MAIWETGVEKIATKRIKSLIEKSEAGAMGMVGKKKTLEEKLTQMQRELKQDVKRIFEEIRCRMGVGQCRAPKSVWRLEYGVPLWWGRMYMRKLSPSRIRQEFG